MSRSGIFLIGSTILNKFCALTLRHPYFEGYTAETKCDHLKLVAGVSSVGKSGEVCDISKIEPVTELRPDAKKGPILVLISVSFIAPFKNIL